MALQSAARYRFARFELQPDERRLLDDGQTVPLGPRAFDLLLALVEHSGQLVTKSELLARVWGRVVVEDNALQAHVSALRKALGPEAITTVSGQGYRFVLEVHSVQASPEPAPRSSHNLPQQLTSFIGREREIAELRSLLASTRLLTLTGAGGCGKTRLALQVAGVCCDDFPDGVRLVELAPLADGALTVQTVAKALGVAAEPGRELIDTVVAWLGAKRLLLVLDNAEHLLDASAQLTEQLLRQCTRLAILATSRERLGVPGELVYRVPSLQVPGNDPGADVLASEAARLFIDRARLQQPDFEVLTRRDAEALASICRRLDGIALAIELAVPRLRVISLQALGDGLDDRFQFLNGGSRTALPRHRTLRSLIDWSHELLSEAERAVLRRASVFAGGWTLEAAEAVCAGGGVARAEVLDVLTSLADKSMVVADLRGEEARFGMLETIRLYARQALRDSGEQLSTDERHLDHLIALVPSPERKVAGAGAQSVLVRLDTEKDNLRAALARCEQEPSLLLRGLQLAGLLYSFWAYRGYAEEGRQCLERLFAVTPADGRGAVHARALFAHGRLASFGSSGQDGIAPLREAIELWRQLGNRVELAQSLGALGELERGRGDYLAARSLYEEALPIAREAGNMHVTAMALGALAHVAVRLGEHEVAQALLDECLPITRAMGPHEPKWNLSVLGWARHMRGDFAAARAALTESVQLFREAGDLVQMAWVLTMLAEVCQDLQDLPAARAAMREALEAVPTGPQSWLEPSGLESMAGLALGLGDAMNAARLYGCVQGLAEHTCSDASWNPQRHERLAAAAREALKDDAAFDRVWQEGRSWRLEDAIRCARGLFS